MTMPDETTFLADVAEHRMTVLRDDGVNRHICFRRPDTICMGFEVITWPGYLCYTGDMGTYVFRRLHDMFEFFRANPGEEHKINPGYWGEKVVAEDRDRVKAYSADVATRKIEEWMVDNDIQPEARYEIRNMVLPCARDHEYMLREAMRDFEFQGVTFDDYYSEADFNEYGYRFIWCCYALRWGIRQYDAAKVDGVVEFPR